MRTPRISISFLMMLVLGGVAILFSAAASTAQTNPAVSGSKASNGYPLWYQDANGVRVDACLNDPALCVLLPEPGYDPTKPTVFTSNFPSEFFYTVADSDKITTPGCGQNFPPDKAFMRAGVEGTFLNGRVVPGEQILFGRLRLVVRGGLCPNTNYKITHPYGELAVTTDNKGSLGNGAGVTEDVGCLGIPCDFTLPLGSQVFRGFLRWDPNVAPAAPAGYLGDNATLHKIVGSPTGNNVFRISDANGATLVETTLFTVSGRIAGPLFSATQTLDFGGQGVGATSTSRVITFTNFNPANLTVAGPTISGANAADFAVFKDDCIGKTLAQDQSCTMELTFTPGALGVRTGQLSVAHDLLPSPQSVALTGTGIAVNEAPVAVLSATSLAYAPQRVRTYADKTVTVTNTGNAPLGVTGAQLQGNDAAQFGIPFDTCTGSFVAPAASCEIVVRFAPKVAASFTAKLQINDNASGSPQEVALSGAGTGGLAAVSPTVDPDNGFPNWYQDENAVQVQPCLNAADTNCVVLADAFFDPALPLAFPTNFPGEFFYWIADSPQLGTPGCAASNIPPDPQGAKMRVAVEGTFGNAAGRAAVGEQIVFGRLRIVVRGGLCPNAKYRFTHPYGTEEIVTDGQGSIGNGAGFTQDIGCLGAPCNFSDALSSPVFGGFLKWDPAVAPAAPAGYLGDAVTLHRVVGSPYTQPGATGPANYFRIQSVNEDGTDGPVVVESDEFTVSGKLAGPIVLVPSTLTFAPQVTNTTSAAQTVTVQNIGIADVTINQISFTGQTPGAWAMTDSCNGLVAAGASCSVSITYTPTVEGPAASAMTVDHSGLNSPVSVALSGTGVLPRPIANVSPTSLTFGNQKIGVPSAAQAVTLSNSGNADLVVNSISIGGTNAGDYSQTNDCATVVAGASCTINVVFTPSAAGVKSASIQIDDNGAGSPRTVSLSGTAVSPATTTSISAPAVNYPAASTVVVSVTSGLGIPTGSVSLVVDGAAALVQAVDANGKATYNLGSKTVGSHTLQASFTGTGGYLNSSATGSFVVNPASTTTTITAPAVTCATFTCSASVTVAVSSAAGVPTGTVSLRVDNILQPVTPTLSATGTATFNLTNLSNGSHPLVAIYGGTGNFQGSSANGSLSITAAVENLVVSTATATRVTSRRGVVTANWNITGTTNQLRNDTITIRLARTGALIGTAKPNNKTGAWAVSVTGSTLLPIAGDSVSVTSTFTTTPILKAVTIN